MKIKTLYPVATFVLIALGHAFYTIWRAIQISKQWANVGDINWLSVYFERGDYMLGVSYGLAVGFTTHAFIKIFKSRQAATGVVGGITLTGVLYASICFLLGCCGSPMLAVYLGVFGPSFMGFTKPLILVLTLVSVIIGYFWLERKTKCAGSCCHQDQNYQEVTSHVGC